MRTLQGRSFQGTLIALLLVTTGIAAWALWQGLTGWFEALGFVTGAVCVWLTTKEHIWNWPIGLVNSAASAIVFFDQRLNNDAALQVIYFVLGILGWYWWLRGGTGKTALQIGETSRKEWPWLAAIMVLGTMALTALNYRILGAAPFLDAATTVVSLVAQYMITRKSIENWLLWIAVDLVYVPLYCWKGLYLFALLYAVFTLMAIAGLREWTRLRAEQGLGSSKAPLWRPTLAFIAIGAVTWGWMGWESLRFERFFGDTLRVVRASDSATLQFVAAGAAPNKLSDAEFLIIKSEVLDPLAWHPGERWRESNPLTRPAITLEFSAGTDKATFHIDSYAQTRVDGKLASVEAWVRALPQP